VTRYLRGLNDGETYWHIMGTGFLVNEEGYVITNAHVINTAQEVLRNSDSTNKPLQVVFVGAGYQHPIYNYKVRHGTRFSAAGIEVVDIDQINDIALLKTRRADRIGFPSHGPDNMNEEDLIRLRQASELMFSPCRLSDIEPDEGTMVAISGYPLQIPTMVSQVGIIASNSFEEKVNLGSNDNIYNVFIHNFVIDATLNPGNSGAPVYFQDGGEIIGVVRAYQPSPISPYSSLSQNSGLVLVVPIKRAIDLLRKHNISWY